MAIDGTGDGGRWLAEARATLALGLPLALTNLAQMAILTTDVVMMGWLGAEALAAGALGVGAYMVVLVLCFGPTVAVSPMVAQVVGARRRVIRDSRRTLRQGLWACVILGLPSVMALTQTADLLAWSGQDPALAVAAGEYLAMLSPGFIPTLWFFTLRSFIAAIDRPTPALVATVVAIASNAFTNWVFMFGNLGMPALGLVGAGISSTLSNLLMCAILAGWLVADRRLGRWQVFGRFWRADWPRLGEVFRLGLPLSATMLLEAGLFISAAFLMGLIGTAELAAHQMAIQIASCTFMVPYGLSQAATVRVGWAVGQRDRAAVTRAGWTALALGIAFMGVMALGIWLFARPLAELLLSAGDPLSAAAVEHAVIFLYCAAVFQVVDGAQAIGAGALRGLKDTTVPMVNALIGYWAVGFTVAVWLGFRAGWGGLGIWIGLAAGLLVAAILMVGRFALRERLGLLGWRD